MHSKTATAAAEKAEKAAKSAKSIVNRFSGKNWLGRTKKGGSRKTRKKTRKNRV